MLSRPPREPARPSPTCGAAKACRPRPHAFAAGKPGETGYAADGRESMAPALPPDLQNRRTHPVVAVARPP
jgi:hypothetical protein